MNSVIAFFAYFAGEGRLIFKAPATFATALVLFGLLIWGALSWRYSGQIENLQSTVLTKDGVISAKDAMISEYKDKLRGATPDQAKKRLDALELQVAAILPRRLSEEKKQIVAKIAASAKGSKIEIASDMAIADARPFATDLAHAFQLAGWDVGLPMVIGVSNRPQSGIALRVSDVSRLSSAATAAKAALEAANIAFDLQPGLSTAPAPPPGMENQYARAADVAILVTSR